MLRDLVSPAFASALLLGAMACAPIQLGAGDFMLRDGGNEGPLVDSDGGGGASTSDAGSAPGVSATEGFRAACGVIDRCVPDDTRGCTAYEPRDGGVPSAFDDGGAGDAAFDDAATGDGGSSSMLDAGSAAALGDAGLTASACRLAVLRDGTACAPAGLGEAHAPCNADADCAAGLACAGGTCERTCCSTSARCAPEGACVLAPHTGQDGRFVPVCAARRACAFVGANSCGAAGQCGFAGDDGSPVCVSVGPATEGASCALAPCARGLVCIGASNLERCAKTCDPSKGGGCPLGQRCRAHPALFGTADVGYCTPAE